MGGKKKGGAKKAKGKKGDDDGEINQDELHDILKAQVEALKTRLVLEQERRDNADSKRDEIREKEKQMDDDMEEHKEQTRTTVKHMTKIYRSMEESVNMKIVECEKEVADQEAEKKRLKEEIGQVTKEKDEMVQDMDEKLSKLQQRIDTMSSDFAEMLKSTLNKM